MIGDCQRFDIAIQLRNGGRFVRFEIDRVHGISVFCIFEYAVKSVFAECKGAFSFDPGKVEHFGIVHVRQGIEINHPFVDTGKAIAVDGKTRTADVMESGGGLTRFQICNGDGIEFQLRTEINHTAVVKRNLKDGGEMVIRIITPVCAVVEIDRTAVGNRKGAFASRDPLWIGQRQVLLVRGGRNEFCGNRRRSFRKNG